jgi:hypothetical protein
VLYLKENALWGRKVNNKIGKRKGCVGQWVAGNVGHNVRRSAGRKAQRCSRGVWCEGELVPRRRGRLRVHRAQGMEGREGREKVPAHVSQLGMISTGGWLRKEVSAHVSQLDTLPPEGEIGKKGAGGEGRYPPTFHSWVPSSH